MKGRYGRTSGRGGENIHKSIGRTRNEKKLNDNLYNILPLIKCHQFIWLLSFVRLSALAAMRHHNIINDCAPCACSSSQRARPPVALLALASRPLELTVYIPSLICKLINYCSFTLRLSRFFQLVLLLVALFRFNFESDFCLALTVCFVAKR